MWNASSTACLFMVTCETDATNQSYYGESRLHYLPADPARADSACAVAMPKDGPVHDVQWSPAGDYFVVVAGFMPAKVLALAVHNPWASALHVVLHGLLEHGNTQSKWADAYRYVVCGQICMIAFGQCSVVAMLIGSYGTEYR
eukprot:GHRR01036458.1.p2 GENE.GHRR01036458.1~~GHRR01036458.1.p2  ORF type:complete len:143 (+),score=31.62 GHRR01036458.1:341-769(+)